jgi:hypothetical protein
MRACVVFNLTNARWAEAVSAAGLGFVASGRRAVGEFRPTIPFFEEFHVGNHFSAGRGCGSWFEPV